LTEHDLPLIALTLFVEQPGMTSGL